MHVTDYMFGAPLQMTVTSKKDTPGQITLSSLATQGNTSQCYDPVFIFKDCNNNHNSAVVLNDLKHKEQEVYTL